MYTHVLLRALKLNSRDLALSRDSVYDYLVQFIWFIVVTTFLLSISVGETSLKPSVQFSMKLWLWLFLWAIVYGAIRDCVCFYWLYIIRLNNNNIVLREIEYTFKKERIKVCGLLKLYNTCITSYAYKFTIADSSNFTIKKKCTQYNI